MTHLAKRVMRAAIRRAGYDVVRQETTIARRPAVSFEFTSLREYRRETDSIPGLVAPESLDILYALCRTQDVQGDVLEIGSWQGKSTSYLGRAVKDSGNGALVAVDHFKGNPGSAYTVGDPDRFRATLEENLLKLGLRETVEVLPLPSAQAFDLLKHRRFRFIFIDGDHSEEGVETDIGLFCALLAPGGIVVFDDFDATQSGLVRAVERWVQARQPETVFGQRNMLICKL